MECKFCKVACRKAGWQKNGRQRFYCKNCRKYQQQTYRYKSYGATIDTQVGILVCESVGIRGIARVLRIAVGTVLRKIKQIAAAIKKPAIPMHRKSVEIDEMRTYIKHKGNEYWVAYALCSTTKQVLDFNVGKRSKRTLKTVVDTAQQSIKQKHPNKASVHSNIRPLQ